jgi:hypothetical protein
MRKFDLKVSRIQTAAVPAVALHGAEFWRDERENIV